VIHRLWSRSHQHDIVRLDGSGFRLVAASVLPLSQHAGARGCDAWKMIDQVWSATRKG
jgi:hypothetical protein